MHVDGIGMSPHELSQPEEAGSVQGSFEDGGDICAPILSPEVCVWQMPEWRLHHQLLAMQQQQ
eukprot:919824-Prorocentrum_lima.AAC.1